MQPPAGQQQQQRQTATTWTGPTASTWAAQTAAQPTTSAPPITSNVNPNNHHSFDGGGRGGRGGRQHAPGPPAAGGYERAAAAVGWPADAQDALAAGARDLGDDAHEDAAAHLLQAQPGAAMVHPNAAPLLPLPTQQAAMNMAAPSCACPTKYLRRRRHPATGVRERHRLRFRPRVGPPRHERAACRLTDAAHALVDARLRLLASRLGTARLVGQPPRVSGIDGAAPHAPDTEHGEQRPRRARRAAGH